VVGRIKTHCGHFYLCPVIHRISSIFGTTRAPPAIDLLSNPTYHSRQ